MGRQTGGRTARPAAGRKSRLASCLCAVLCGLASLRAQTGGGLTVMTWNVENYVAENRLVDGAYRPDYPKPEAAKAGLRAAVREAGPDVLALEEMGPEPYLEELQRDLAAEGAPYPYRALVAGPDEQRHVAVLSRVPLVRVVPHADVPCRLEGRTQRVRRGVLEVAVGAEDGELTLFVVHLKSRHTEEAGDPGAAGRRGSEAEGVRDLVLQRFPDPGEARFLIVGDFNDGPRSRALRALTSRGTADIAAALSAADPAGDTWTHHYREEASYSQLDYILVSPGLRPRVAGGRAWIHDSPAVRAASDHRPVLVRLEGAGAKKAGPGEGRP